MLELEPTYDTKLLDFKAGRRISVCTLAVLRAIARLHKAHNDTPTVAEIAFEAGVNERTVRRARACAEQLDLLLTERRYAHNRQLSNRYTPRTPPGRVICLDRKRGGGQGARRKVKGSKKERLRALTNGIGPPAGDRERRLQELWLQQRAERQRNIPGYHLMK